MEKRKFDIFECREDSGRVERIPSLRKVMGIDGEALDPGAGARGHRPSRERAMEERNEWLGQAAGQRLEPVAETGTEDEGLFHGMEVEAKGDFLVER